jgi:hypothetical protein
MYRSKLDQCAISIEQAREKVARATEAHSRGGSVQAVNKANRELADAHATYRQVYGERVPLPGR